MPSPFRTAVRQKVAYLKAAYIDLRLFATGKADPELPPMRLRFVGMGDFRSVGGELVKLLVEIGGLRASDRVLDIGCGIGRVAIPLTRFLESTYDGFDVVKAAIRWCRHHITAHHPNFRFQYANLYNSFYNRHGVPASRYCFPYPDASFDFAFATSLFTHLDIDSAQHYLAETARVLRPGGRLLGTFYVLGSGPSPSLDFGHHYDGYALIDPDTPDAAIAFSEDALPSLLPSSSWRIVRRENGAWAGRTDAPTYQDTIVAERI
jgi:SAM-dependent methyltransferase